MRTRKAYIMNYEKYDIFQNDFEEFDHAKEVVEQLMDEYKAAERANYVDWNEDYKS